MTGQLPFLALDSAGRRTILNDYSLPMSGGKTTIRKEKTMPNIMTSQQVESHTKKLVARLLGQDGAPDDETAARIKEFLKTKLSPGDHAQVCDMLEAAAGDPEAEDDNGEGGGEMPRAALDAKIGFDRRYPGLAHIKIDNSGIAIPKRAARYSNAATKSFADRYPGLAKIRQA